MPFILSFCWLLTVFLSPIATEDHKPVELRFYGQVLSPSGDPVPHAKLTVLSGMNRTDRPGKTLTADADGKFEFMNSCLFSTNIIASGLDGEWLGEARFSSWNARVDGREPIQIRLKDCLKVTVSVTQDGKPVPGTLVVDSETMGGPIETDADGTAILRLLDANQGSQSIYAWHPERGVAAAHELPGEGRGALEEFQFELQKFQPVVAEVLDIDGKAVPDMEFLPNASWKEDSGRHWFDTTPFPTLSARTDVDGRAELSWTPTGTRRVDAHIRSPNWLMDRCEAGDAPNLHRLRVREKFPIRGQVVAPEGVSRHGLLISASAFGEGDNVDIVETRTNAQGEFMFFAAPGYEYVLTVCDHEWCSDTLAGVLLAKGQTETDPITLNLQPAIPAEITVEVGPDGDLAVDRFVDITYVVDTEEATHHIWTWLKTDESGKIRTGLRRGSHTIELDHLKRREKKEFKINSDEPVKFLWRLP